MNWVDISLPRNEAESGTWKLTAAHGKKGDTQASVRGGLVSKVEEGDGDKAAKIRFDGAFSVRDPDFRVAKHVFDALAESLRGMSCETHGYYSEDSHKRMGGYFTFTASLTAVYGYVNGQKKNQQARALEFIFEQFDRAARAAIEDGRERAREAGVDMSVRGQAADIADMVVSPRKRKAKVRREERLL